MDHVSNYRAPKESEEMDDVTKEVQSEGCGPQTLSLNSSEGSEDDKTQKHKKHKKEKKEKKKRKKDKGKNDREVPEEQRAFSLSPRSNTIQEKDDPSFKKHSSKHSERSQKPESREVRKHHPISPEGRMTCLGGAEDRERELKKEKPKHEHESSSRREEREVKHRDRYRGRSSDMHSGRHERRSEGRSHRSRSRSRDKSHRHKRAQHSREREHSNPSNRRHHH